MTATETIGEGLTFEKVWAALMENREQMKATDEQIKAAGRQMKAGNEDLLIFSYLNTHGIFQRWFLKDIDDDIFLTRHAA